MAYATREEEAAAILNALEEVGLQGGKLAMSAGTEKRLAEQVADFMKIPKQEWHVEFVKGQVSAAVEMLDIENRLQGGVMSPAMQRIMDARDAPVEREDVIGPEISKSEPLKVPKKGTLGKSVRLKSGRVVAEDEVEGQVLQALLKELEVMRAPILEEINSTMDPGRAAKAVMSKYRPSTVRRYLASWQHFRRWHESMSRPGLKPTGIGLVDYLYMREEEGMGASIPLAVSRAVGWFESIGGFDEDERIGAHPMVNHVVRELTRKLEERAPPIKRAPRWPAAFFLAMERIVASGSHPKGRRIGAWMKLVKAWASLRFSDAANLRCGMLRFYDGKLCGMLLKTKTTGAGKRVRELPVFVGPDAFIVHKEWLGVGFELLKDASSQEGPFVFGEGIFNRVATGHTQMKYYEAAAIGADVMEEMRTLDGTKMLPEGWCRFWTEHSERATLASGLAAISAPKDERDLLGRWCPEGSDQYVRTYNAIVGRLQATFASVARSEEAYLRLDEGAIAEDLKDWLVQAWNADRGQAETAVEKWKKQCGMNAPPQLFGGGDLQLGESPTEIFTPTEDGEAHEVEEPEAPIGEEAKGSDEPVKKKVKVMPPALLEDREGAYVIVYRRAGCGTLHKLKDGCWMAKKRSFARADILQEMPEPELYSNVCKLCWPPEPTSEGGTSSEESCDELDLSDKEA